MREEQKCLSILGQSIEFGMFSAVNNYKFEHIFCIRFMQHLYVLYCFTAILARGNGFKK